MSAIPVPPRYRYQRAPLSPGRCAARPVPPGTRLPAAPRYRPPRAASPADHPAASVSRAVANLDNVFYPLFTTCIGVLLPGEACETEIKAASRDNGPFSTALAGSAGAFPLTGVVGTCFTPAFVWAD